VPSGESFARLGRRGKQVLDSDGVQTALVVTHSVVCDVLVESQAILLVTSASVCDFQQESESYYVSGGSRSPGQFLLIAVAFERRTIQSHNVAEYACSPTSTRTAIIWSRLFARWGGMK
jgi:hypothetical protein